MKSWLTWPVLLLSVLLLAACGQGGDDSADEATENDSTEVAASEDDENSEEEDETPAIPVEVAVGSRGDVYATYSGTAPVEALQDALVIAKVGGEVREIFVEEGDDVKAGQLLARLDGDRLRLEQRQAEANLSKLQRDHQRNVDLRDRGLISAGDFEKIQYEMEALEAANNLAKLQLSYSDIRAPIDGVISERFIKVGNTLEVETSTFQVTSLEPLVSYLFVPEREYRRIAADQNATMTIDALAGKSFIGTVARVSPIIDPATGTFKITIEVIDETRQLKPGMFARVSVVYDIHENALQVPRSALVAEANATTVYVIKDDLAERREVQTGFSSDGQVEVTEGLNDGERFVVVGQTGLKDGSKVSVIGEESPAESTANNDENE
jgi:membrane fusion protein (multidrug efflux system)